MLCERIGTKTLWRNIIFKCNATIRTECPSASDPSKSNIWPSVISLKWWHCTVENNMNVRKMSGITQKSCKLKKCAPPPPPCCYPILNYAGTPWKIFGVMFQCGEAAENFWDELSCTYIFETNFETEQDTKLRRHPKPFRHAWLSSQEFDGTLPGTLF